MYYHSADLSPVPHRAYSRIGCTRSFGSVLIDIHRVTFNILVEQRLDYTHHRLVHIDVSARFRHLRQRLDRMRSVSGVLPLCFPNGDLQGNHVSALSIMPCMDTQLAWECAVLTLTMAAATAESFEYQDFAFCTNLTEAARTTSFPSHVLPPNAFSKLGHSNLAASDDI